MLNRLPDTARPLARSPARSPGESTASPNGAEIPNGVMVLGGEPAPASGLLAAATALAARRELPTSSAPDIRLPWGNDGIPSVKPEKSVIIEQDGIHFINSEAFSRDSDKEELDGDFKKLVESVVDKT